MAIKLYGRTTKLQGSMGDWRRILGALDDDSGRSVSGRSLIRRIAKQLAGDHLPHSQIVIDCDDGDVARIEKAAKVVGIDANASWPNAVVPDPAA